MVASGRERTYRTMKSEEKWRECQDWDHPFQKALSCNIIIFPFSSKSPHKNTAGGGWGQPPGWLGL